MSSSPALLLAALSGLSLAGGSLGYKMAERRQCRAPAFTLAFALTGGAFAGIAAGLGATDWREPRLWMLGIGMGLLNTFAIYLIMVANRLGPASVSWTVLNLALLVPVFVSPFLFHEAVLWLDPIILLVFTLMLVIFSRSVGGGRQMRRGRAAPYLLVLLGIFMAQGCVLLGNKTKYALFGEANTAGLAFMTYLAPAAVAAILVLVKRQHPLVAPSEWKAGGVVGLCNSLGTILYLGAMSLPSTVAFPLSGGVSLLGGVFLTRLVYGERLTPASLAGVSLGLVAMLLTVYREPLATSAGEALARLLQ